MFIKCFKHDNVNVYLETFRNPKDGAFKHFKTCFTGFFIILSGLFTILYE